MTAQPTTAEAREMALAELRVERLRQQLIVAHIDLVAAGVQAGFIPAHQRAADDGRAVRHGPWSRR